MIPVQQILSYMQKGITPQQALAEMARSIPGIATIAQNLQGLSGAEIDQFAMNSARSMGVDPQSMLKRSGIDQGMFNSMRN
jgi:hypothetical protein